jgi:hypothetical protein
VANETESNSGGGKPAPDNHGAYMGFWPTLFQTVARAPGTYMMGITGGALLLSIVVIIGWVLLKNGDVLKDLAEPANARGIITFIISFAAIGVALLLILYSLFGTSKPDQYRQAREIYTGLMGILGTIVGFYFGSAEKAQPKLSLAEPRFVGSEFLCHIDGGTPPYRFHITPDSLSDTTSRGERVSTDGWIEHRLKSARPDTLALRLEVWDSKNLLLTKEFEPTDAGNPKPAAAAQPTDTSVGAHFPKHK